jgi:hypothetical protein
MAGRLQRHPYAARPAERHRGVLLIEQAHQGQIPLVIGIGAW